MNQAIIGTIPTYTPENVPGVVPEIYDIEAMFLEIAEVTEEQLGCKFDELSSIAAEQPDDMLVLAAVRTLVVEARNRGYIDQAMQMAMTLGAMACTHNHMQELASDVGKLVTDDYYDETSQSHRHEEKDVSDKHDVKTCKDCLAGRSCRRKH